MFIFNNQYKLQSKCSLTDFLCCCIRRLKGHSRVCRCAADLLTLGWVQGQRVQGLSFSE